LSLIIYQLYQILWIFLFYFYTKWLLCNWFSPQNKEKEQTNSDDRCQGLSLGQKSLPNSHSPNSDPTHNYYF